MVTLDSWWTCPHVQRLQSGPTKSHVATCFSTSPSLPSFPFPALFSSPYLFSPLPLCCCVKICGYDICVWVCTECTMECTCTWSQLLRVSSSCTTKVLGFEFRSPGLHSKCLTLLRCFSGLRPFFFTIFTCKEFSHFLLLGFCWRVTDSCVSFHTSRGTLSNVSLLP